MTTSKVGSGFLQFVNSSTNFGTITGTSNGLMTLTSASGNVRIVGVTDPSGSQDAATKNYVDINNTITNDTTTNAIMFPTWVTSSSGVLPLKVSSTYLGFNPSTITLFLGAEWSTGTIKGPNYSTAAGKGGSVTIQTGNGGSLSGNSGDLTLDTGTVNSGTVGIILLRTGNTTRMSISSLGIINITNTTASTTNATGALTLVGGIGINNTTDASSLTNGGTFTTAGGMTIAKKLYVGGTLTLGIENSTNTIKIPDSSTFSGGSLSIIAGNSTGSNTSTGGNLNIISGDGGTNGGDGGAITINTGSGGGSGTGGNLTLASGDGNRSGDIILRVSSQDGIVNVAGNISILGTRPFLGTSVGSNITMTAGNGGTTSGAGGNISINSGSVTSGSGNSGSVTLSTGTVSAGSIGSIIFQTGNLTRMTVNGSGVVTVSNLISGVTDPVSAQDAATKNYVDTRTLSVVTNMLFNGSFKIYQRSSVSRSLSVLASTFAYTFDRWQIGTGVNQISTVSSQPGTNSGDFVCRVQRNDFQVGTSEMSFSQSLTREMSYMLIGKKCTVSFSARKSSFFSPTSGNITVKVIYGTGTTDKSGTQSAFNEATNAINSTQALTDTLVRYSFTSSNIIPTNATQLCFAIYWTPIGTAALDYFDITNVQLENNAFASDFCAVSAAEEFARCVYFYQKVSSCSCYATATTAGQLATHTSTMRIIPTIGSVNTAGTTNGGLTVTDNLANFTQTSFNFSSYTGTTSGISGGFGNMVGMTAFRPMIFYDATASFYSISLTSELTT